MADAHVHFFGRGYRSRYGGGWARRDEVAAYDALRRAHGINLALVVGYELQHRYEGNNAEIALWAERHRWMACLASVNAKHSLTLTALRAFWEQGFIGLSLYCLSAADAEDIAGWPKRVTQFLNARRAILSFNATPEATRVLTNTLPRFDGCACLFSHLGLPGQFHETPAYAVVRQRLAALLALAPYSHIGVKLSGIYAISDPPHAYPHVAAQPFVHEMAEVFGGRRLYWGSDYPPCLDHISFVQAIHCVVGDTLPPQTIADLYGANLHRIVSTAREASSIAKVNG